nr:hypothetical protein GCM10025732_25900 [Glycomyces mayteni]
MPLPVLLQAPPEPIPVRPIRIDAKTTPRQLTLRAIAAAPRQMVPAAMLLVMHQVGESLVPVIMGFAIDQAVATGDYVRLALCVLLLGADFALLSYSYRFGSRFGLLGIEAVQHRLRTLVADRLLDPKGVKGRAGLPGVSLSIAASDVNNLARAVSIAAWPVGELAAVLLTGTVLMVLSWELGLIVLIGVPLLLLIMDRAGGPCAAAATTSPRSPPKPPGRPPTSSPGTASSPASAPRAPPPTGTARPAATPSTGASTPLARKASTPAR